MRKTIAMPLRLGLVTLALAQLLTATANASAQTPAIDQRELDRLAAALERISKDHVDEVDQASLVTAAIRGMVSLLDGHSEYFTAQSFRNLQLTHRGLAGLGVELAVERGALKVITPLDDTPAARAGLRANDIITEIDHMPLHGMSFSELVTRVTGPVNTRVHLSILRDGKPVEISIIRETIRFRAVRGHAEGDIAYIRSSYFNEQTTHLLPKVAAEVAKQIDGDKLKGYILDLRNNPGGLLDQAVAVADAFLDSGEIVSLRGRNPEQVQRFAARPGDIANGKPLIVLINGGSAGTAEVVAGALQDHKRATLIGTRSYGKGLVQTVVPLGIGNGALRLSTERYFTPSGRPIQTTGISPDIDMPQDSPETPENDAALQLARDLLRGIKYHVAFPSDSPAIPTPQ